jgi:hypothetical protein
MIPRIRAWLSADFHDQMVWPWSNSRSMNVPWAVLEWRSFPVAGEHGVDKRLVDDKARAIAATQANYSKGRIIAWHASRKRHPHGQRMP